MGSIKKRAKDGYWGGWGRREKTRWTVRRLCLPHPAPWRQACRACLANWHIFQQQHFIFFPSLPPLSLSIQEKGLEGSKGGWGLWDMLTQANEKEGKRGENTKRHTQRKRETSKSWGGSTVAAAVVFHWSLERVPSLQAKRHLWSHDHQATLFRSLWELLPGLWKEKDFRPARFSKRTA